jgi:hypothetical protein
MGGQVRNSEVIDFGIWLIGLPGGVVAPGLALTPHPTFLHKGRGGKEALPHQGGGLGGGGSGVRRRCQHYQLPDMSPVFDS